MFGIESIRQSQSILPQNILMYNMDKKIIIHLHWYCNGILTWNSLVLPIWRRLRRKDCDWQEIIDWSHLGEAGARPTPRSSKVPQRPGKDDRGQGKSIKFCTSTWNKQSFAQLFPALFLLPPPPTPSDCHTHQTCKGCQPMIRVVVEKMLFFQLAWRPF